MLASIYLHVHGLRHTIPTIQFSNGCWVFQDELKPTKIPCLLRINSKLVIMTLEQRKMVNPNGMQLLACQVFGEASKKFKGDA